MITYLYGTVMEILEDSVWLRVQNVGYEVFVHARRIPEIFPNSEIGLYCHMMVSDSEIKLYGFLSREELLLFRKLMTVSGVGGKVAQGMVANMEPQSLVAAVVSGDERTLTKLPGVGKKMASRLIFELKDKLTSGAAVSTMAEGKEENRTGAMLAEVMEAMEALGYTRSEVYPILIGLQENGELLERSEENIKLLLKKLAEKKRR